jgi:hypothetical protein
MAPEGRLRRSQELLRVLAASVGCQCWLLVCAQIPCAATGFGSRAQASSLRVLAECWLPANTEIPCAATGLGEKSTSVGVLAVKK